jgi:hypothetical protein
MADRADEAMPRHDSHAVVALGLGVLHTVAFLLTLGWLVYRTGGLGEALAGIGTLLGLGLFAVLWGVIGAFTLYAVRPLDFATVTRQRILERGAIFGGWNGVAFFAPLILFALVAGTVNGAREGPGSLVRTLGTLLFFGAIGGVVAWAFGAIVGILFALLDDALLSLSSLLAPTTRTEPPEAPPADG